DLDPILHLLDKDFDINVRQITGDLREILPLLGSRIGSRKEFPLSRLLDLSLFLNHLGVTPMRALDPQTINHAKVLIEEEISHRMEHDLDTQGEGFQVNDKTLPFIAAIHHTPRRVDWKKFLDSTPDLESLLDKILKPQDLKFWPVGSLAKGLGA